MKIIVRPAVDPQHEIDLTHRLTAAVAEELWRLFGGNEQLNWLEAELHLQRIVGAARAEAEVMDFELVEPSVAGVVAGEPPNPEAVEPRREAPGQSRSASRPRAAKSVRRRIEVTAS